MSDSILTEQAVLNEIADNWSPRRMRDLAASLLRLADAIDQDWPHGQERSIFRWPNKQARIERNAVNLAAKARLIYAQRLRRRAHLSERLLSEPAWDMLLELFMQFAGGAKVSTTSLCYAAHVPMSTALRYVALLEELGMVRRQVSEFDKRIVFVSLTNTGIVAMGEYLETY